MRNSINKGFTLIELLVVIFIIALLATLLLANMVGIRQRGRDAQRKSDISQIQKALELYKISQSPPIYPPTATWRTALQGGANPAMRSVPLDPNCPNLFTCNMIGGANWPNYSYTQDPDGTGDNLTYRLVACLENASDPQRDATRLNPPCGNNTAASFTRREP